MIFGVGTDIVQIARVESALSAHGDRFAERILGAQELDGYFAHPQPVRFLAKRFAAKEAAAKAFGTGFSNGLILSHILVSHDELGRPLLSFVEKAQDFVHQNGISQSHLSLSDEREYALAFVVLESK